MPKLSGGGSATTGGTDGSGNVGIGTTSPGDKVEVVGASTAAKIRLTRDDSTIVDTNGLGQIRFFGTDGDQEGAIIKVEAGGTWAASDSPGRMLLLTTPASSATPATRVQIDPTGRVGIGETTIAAQLHVDQSSASAAIPVLTLDQTDVDDTFINFVGTSAADGTKSISSDTTEDGAKFGAVRVEINGVTKWLRVYDDES